MPTGDCIMHLEVGMDAPHFELADADMEMFKLTSCQAKKNVVLYFYPKDDTPGCTAEACSLRDGFAAIQAAGAVILGVSADSSQSHRAFAEKYHLPFSILADPDHHIIDSFGVKKFPVLGYASRVTFLIDRQGIVRKVIADVVPKDHTQQVLALLKGIS